MKDRYLDNHGMLMEIRWDGTPAVGDALWRTALLNIITDNKYPTDSCYKHGQVFRHPSFAENYPSQRNNCSRDQMVMDQVSRKITHQPLPKVGVKISDTAYQTPDMLLWMKALRGSKLSAWLFHTWNYISLPLLLKRNEKLWKKGRDAYFAPGIKGAYPFYAFHLMSWMTYVLPDSKMKRRVNKICLNYVWVYDYKNLLVRFLNGDKIHDSQAQEYEPQTDFVWGRMADRLPPGITLDPYLGPYPLDKDILLWARDTND